MAGKSTLSFFIVVFLVLSLAGPAAADPELVCGDIPFGASVDKVLQSYKGYEVVKEKTPYIESIGNYALERYFKGGLQKDESGICFLPKVVQKYTLKHKGWKNCDSMTLYFGAFEKGASDYTLFMVKRTHPKPSTAADFKEIFNELAKDLDEVTKTSHTVDQGRIQSFNEQSHTYYLPALVGTWDAKETLVFVMVANSPDGPLPPEEIYVSKPALKRYLETCKTY